jgi:predicted aminopeptidase
VKSATAFNESFAQYAGYHAAARFFATRGDSLKARRALDRWDDERVLAGYYQGLIRRLETFYASKPDSATLDSGRVALGAWSRDTLQQMAPLFKTFQIGPMAARPINNARLVGVLIYRTNLDWFEQWHQKQNGDVREAVAAMKALVTGRQATACLSDWSPRFARSPVLRAPCSVLFALCSLLFPRSGIASANEQPICAAGARSTPPRAF